MCHRASPSILSERFFFLQDETGGIKIYLPTARGNFFPLNLYDRVRLRGIVELASGEHALELEGVDVIETRGSCDGVAPLQLTTGALDHTLEGWLAQIESKVMNVRSSSLELDDGSGMARVTLDAMTGLRFAPSWRG